MKAKQLLADDADLFNGDTAVKRIVQFQIVGGWMIVPVAIFLAVFGLINSSIVRFLIGNGIFITGFVGAYPSGEAAPLTKSRILAGIALCFGIYQMALGLSGVPL